MRITSYDLRYLLFTVKVDMLMLKVDRWKNGLVSLRPLGVMAHRRIIRRNIEDRRKMNKGGLSIDEKII